METGGTPRWPMLLVVLALAAGIASALWVYRVLTAP